MSRWRYKLDTNLPGELGQIADWINTAETVLARGINFDPLKCSPEDNVQHFNQLNEEHAVSVLFNVNEIFTFVSGDFHRQRSYFNNISTSQT
jgi:hypothetical protein